MYNGWTVLDFLKENDTELGYIINEIPDKLFQRDRRTEMTSTVSMKRP